ncbi:MAG TPA: MarC family protein [Syntrophorhabdales bacterium]|nr:MarC family protein [Syntrophorhabdales bacterium]
MGQEVTLFVGAFTTLLAVINPLESLPIFLELLEGKDDKAHRAIALRACLYASILMFFFLLFGRLVLEIFGVPLSMVRIVGGIILTRIGFSLFMPSAGSGLMGSTQKGGNIAFVPLAMPLMFGPGVLATVIGYSSMVKLSEAGIASMGAIVGAIAAATFATYLILAYAKRILGRIGPQGIDAATRIVGFFVSAMGVGLMFHGLVEAVRQYTGTS